VPGSLPLNPYDMILLLLFILLVILGGMLLRRFFVRRKKKGSPFERTEDLFPGHERNFLRMLDQALGEGYRVFGKIQAGALLKTRTALKERDRLAAAEALTGHRFEFVLCRRADLAVVGIVEWENEGSEKKSRSRELWDEVLREAKIPVVRFQPQKTYSLEEIKAALAGKILPRRTRVRRGGGEDWQLGALDRAAAQEEEWLRGRDHLSRAEKKKPVTAPSAPDTPTCPLCGSNMLRRRAANGPHAGAFFWTCSQYPHCPKVIPVKTATRSRQPG